jgi:hypothetical protein
MHLHSAWQPYIPATFDELVSTIAAFTDIPLADVIARTWFERHGFWQDRIRPAEHGDTGFPDRYDVVVSFEVLPTLLRSSARYLGATPFLSLNEGMVLSWYNREELFKPNECVKQERVPSGSRLRLLKDPVLRGHYLSRYFNRGARLIAKLPHVSLARPK